MARWNAVTSVAAVFCLATGACDGQVALFTSRPIALPAGDAGLPEPTVIAPPPAFGSMPPEVPTEGAAPVDVAPLEPSIPSSGSDAGALDEPDGRAPAVPSPVVVGPVAELELLGIAEGEPRLGVCQGGVVIGVRTTANPSEETFGQRLTFIEPICGKVFRQGPDAVGVASGTLGVTRDDALVDWAETDGFQGVPATEVPDPRLVWVLQPATVCPEATPVVVGLSGEYDPIAPDVMNTSAIRSLFVECAPLVLAPNGIDVAADAAGHQLISNADSFAADGAAAYRSSCEGGTVTTQIQVHAGFWLDGFVLGCSTLRVE